jgi:hypothetical protein
MKHFVKKTLIVTAIAIIINPMLAQASDANTKAYCNNNWKQASPGWTNISSTHGVTIINKTKVALVYDIYFDNAIQYPKMREMPLDYTDAPYTPNAHAEYHVKLEPGQRYDFGEITIQKLAGFPKRGVYKTWATTIVKFNGALLDKCDHYTNIEIS